MKNSLKGLLLAAVTIGITASCSDINFRSKHPKGEPQMTQNDPNAKPKTDTNAPKANPQVELVTSKGTIVIELNSEKAPITTANFIQYVNDGHFNGTIFHRVIPGFMIQGGGMDKDMKEKKTRAPIKNEGSNGLKNLRGTLSMARTPNPDSATSQFFINTVDNDFLNYKGPSNPGYAVFAKVVKGMDVVDAIAKVKTGSRGMHDDVPVEAVVITSAKVVTQ